MADLEKEYEADQEIQDDENDPDNDPDFYECFCCGHSCVKRPAWGGNCPRCGAHMEEGYF